MKLVAATRVLDEEDIIESFARHTAGFVCHHIFLDNGSGDRTLEILANLREEGVSIDVYQNNTVTFSEANFNTFLYQAACKAGADWVVFLDADEFIDDRAVVGGLITQLEAFAASSPSLACIKVPLIDYEATRHDDQDELNVPLRIVRRSEKSENYKVIVKVIPQFLTVVVESGSHFATIKGKSIQDEMYHTELRLAHYSERSAYIWIRKFIKGWVKILASEPGIRDLGFSNHYREPFEAMLRDPKLIFEHEHLMGFKNELKPLTLDPIRYVGAPLRYTPTRNDKYQMISSLIVYMKELAIQHAYLIEHSPQAAKIVKSRASEIQRIM